MTKYEKIKFLEDGQKFFFSNFLQILRYLTKISIFDRVCAVWKNRFVAKIVWTLMSRSRRLFAQMTSELVRLIAHDAFYLKKLSDFS